jgi:Fe-Mn family superoxide dismutase
MSIKKSISSIIGNYPFQLPNLPYAYNALEPYIDEQTMHIHHDKHYATYIKNLNIALESYPELQQLPLEDILRMKDSLPPEARTAILNNGGGVYNHTLFFQGLAPASEDVHRPEGNLLAAIETCFGSFYNFKNEFNQLAAGVFGSGWTALASDANGNLSIQNLANQDTLLDTDLEVVFLFDVWEHAYYLKYKNVRMDYIKNLWEIIKLN